jgi:hypothetical protein
MPFLTIPKLPQGNVDVNLIYSLTKALQSLADQSNSAGKGEISSVINAYTAPPTGGTHAQGDFVRNSAPAELGTAGAKYVIFGWICTVAGTPGTWLQQRMLTGN